MNLRSLNSLSVLTLISMVSFGVPLSAANSAENQDKLFRAGAVAIDITPEVLPVLVNGGMYSRTSDKIVDRLHARCIVLDDSETQIAIVVVDSCMLPRELLDEAKMLSTKVTKIPTDRILISATHTHSAPAAMGCLGTDRDERYAKFLPARIARGIQLAHDNLEPARIGWAKSRDPKNIYNRRWLMKEGTAATNPFSGKSNDRAQMNPGNTNPNKIEQTGTVDDEVSVLSLQATDGRPIALLANYSTHYAGSPALSADYFGVFAEEISTLLEADKTKPAFVGIMSNGTSGDTNCVDFSRADRRKFDHHSVAEDTARAALEAYSKIKYRDWVPLAMEESLLTLDVRMPTADEVTKAKAFLKSDEGKKLQSIPAVYARETVLLSEMPPTRELKLQAIRIGDLGIAAIPNEVYTSTGLTIKKESPLDSTFTIELANGAEGYIPPPDQHKLGGYTTWRARTSCLEEEAEPKIRAKIMELLNEVAEPQAALQSPLSPEDSLKYLHVRPGMKVELVASEPLIRDPVAFDWGADGKLWVVEMLDYPTGVEGKPGGRVVYLEDEDEDGHYDKSTLFLDGLNFPLGVMAWRDGVLITAAPDILYAADTDNDGKADKVEKLYTGFFEGNQQLRMNGLRWGLDNWIYCAGGINSGAEGKPGPIKSIKTGEAIELGARDFRIKPDEGLIEPLSGWSQFGRNRDAYGNWFGCQNAKPMFHFVLEDRYLSRNPHVTYPDPKVLISDVPGQRPVFPRSTPGKFHHASQAGRFTSANSAMIYGDELLGKDFIGNSFVSEPVHNLVHREIVERNGVTKTGILGGTWKHYPVTFRSHKPSDEANTEFLASEDTWFRPNTIRTGPDGALWIADMYREIIEHPRWVSDELKPTVDVRTGTDRGRIYRIFPECNSPRKMPRINQLNTDELVALLESPNATLRDMAHIQIVTRDINDAAAPLEKLARTNERPQTRLQAICILDGLGALDSELLQRALKDNNLWIRREALRLAESRLPEVQKDVVGISSAGIPKSNAADNVVGQLDDAVTLQLALTLGEIDSTAATRRLRNIADNNFDDPTMLAAVLSSLNATNIAEFSHGMGLDWPMRQDFIEGLIETAIGLQQPEVVEQIASCLTSPNSPIGKADRVWQMTAIANLQRVSARRSLDVDEFNEAKTIRKNLDTLLAEARVVLPDEQAELDRRLAALNLIASSRPVSQDDWKLITQPVAPRNPHELQQAVVDAVANSEDGAALHRLFASWKSHGPRLRLRILDASLSRTAWTSALLKHVEEKQVAVADIDAAQRQRLLKSGNAAIREKAAKLFSGGTNLDRAQVIATYQNVVATSSTPGDGARGKAVFKQRCSACHKLDDIGNHVGPDLKGLTDKSPSNLLTSILDPNRAVEPRYVSYTAITNEGRIYSGMLADEAGGALTLLDGEGKRHAILRRDLEELIASGKSLMPEGLEKDIDQAAMRDLLKYLQRTLNQP